jgi:hypothetical protein
VKVTTHLNLVPRLRICGAISTLTLVHPHGVVLMQAYIFMTWHRERAISIFHNKLLITLNYYRTYEKDRIFVQNKVTTILKWIRKCYKIIENYGNDLRITFFDIQNMN